MSFCFEALFIFILLILLKKYLHYRYNSKTCLIGKTILITGGSRGIGYATALDLAARGCKLIIACRSGGKNLQEKLRAATNNNNIFVKYLDLSSLRSVRQFADDLKQNESKLDVLILNAGVSNVYNAKYTEDGLSPIVASNYLGHFLLTHLLIDLLKKSEKPRIVVLSSLMLIFNNLRLDNVNYLETDSSWDKLMAFGNTKMCLTIFGHSLAEKLKNHGITVNSTHPGAMKTEMSSPAQATLFQKIALKLYLAVMYFMHKDVNEITQWILKLAIDPELDNVTGQYYCDIFLWPVLPPSRINDRKFAHELWDLSEELVKLRNEEKIS